MNVENLAKALRVLLQRPVRVLIVVHASWRMEPGILARELAISLSLVCKVTSLDSPHLFYTSQEACPYEPSILFLLEPQHLRSRRFDLFLYENFAVGSNWWDDQIRTRLQASFDSNGLMMPVGVFESLTVEQVNKLCEYRQ